MDNLESHRINVLLPSMNVADARKWISNYPNLGYVSYDGIQMYAFVVNGTHTNTVQISDGFQLI